VPSRADSSGCNSEATRARRGVRGRRGNAIARHSRRRALRKGWPAGDCPRQAHARAGGAPIACCAGHDDRRRRSLPPPGDSSLPRLLLCGARAPAGRRASAAAGCAARRRARGARRRKAGHRLHPVGRDAQPRRDRAGDRTRFARRSPTGSVDASPRCGTMSLTASEKDES